MRRKSLAAFNMFFLRCCSKDVSLFFPLTVAIRLVAMDLPVIVLSTVSFI